MKYPILYLAAIVLVNYLFTVVPSIGVFQPVSIVVGVIFILRDYAQKQIGHYVIPIMFIGVALSYFLASPFVAYASAAAFFISETIDWVVYSTLKKPLKQRILISSLVSTPIDSAVFLLMIGHFTWLTFAVMFVSKMASALFVWSRLK